MIFHDYKIIEIKEINHSKYGKCLMVYANPITKKEQTFEFSSIVDSRTIKFLFPFKYLQELQRIANKLLYWSPSDNWYLKERIYDNRINKYGPIYVHQDLEIERLDMMDSDDIPDLDDGKEITQESIIPDIGYKFRKIIGDWEKETEKHNTEYGYDKDAGPADFVDWEYSEKKGFFSWLFNDDTINDYSDLTDKQEEAYDDFLFELDKEGLSPIG